MYSRSAGIAAVVLMVGLCASSWGRGVTPYLPLNLSPDIERDVERILIFSDQPVMRRPIAAATVLDALPRACVVDPQLCSRVRRYLERYMHDAGITQAQAEVALVAGDSEQALPNAHGMKVDSAWQLVANGYYQLNDHVLASVGGVAYQERATPTGTLFSVGFDWAQLDIGYRDHWYSPSADGGFLIGTQAATMPSLTVSNYEPISPLGISYELFVAQMSSSDKIAYPGGDTSGHPRLTGLQLSIEPAPGYALAVNRLLQYGGGARGQAGLSGLFNALFRNDSAQIPDSAGQANEFGNQLASITSSFIYPGKVPFAFRFEYAGEDNLYRPGYRLGKVVLAAGLDFPRLGDRYDLSYDVSERQDAWYTHHLYGDGLTNYGNVIGHWFGERRISGDSPGGYTQSLRIGRRADSGDYWQMQYRNSVNWRFAVYPYEQAHELALRYATQWFGRSGAVELNAGRDVFGEHFIRLSGALDFAAGYRASLPETASSNVDANDSGTEMFIDIGVNRSGVHKIFWDFLPDETVTARVGYHAGFGVRRQASARGDLGVRIEFDRVDGHELISLRALDYRYRFGKRLTAGIFFGAARYEIQLPAWGYYLGGGVQYRNLLPGWDLGMDLRHHEKISRNNLLPTDRGYGVSTVSFRDIDGTSMYLSRRF